MQFLITEFIIVLIHTSRYLNVPIFMAGFAHPLLLHPYFAVSLPDFFVVIQLLSCIWLFVTPWTAALQASLTFTISWSLLRLMSMELVMPSKHLVLCCPLFSWLQSFPALGSFLMSHFFASDGHSIGTSASASVLPDAFRSFWMNIQSWFPLGLTGWISLQFKGLSRVFSNTTVQKHQFFGTQPSLWSNSHIHTWLLEKP